jgi:hypothetical protein
VPIGRLRAGRRRRGENDRQCDPGEVEASHHVLLEHEAGAGGGALHYDLLQFGDFVDFQTTRVFASTLTSGGWAPVVQAFGGVDVRVLKRIYVSLDGRYQWSNASLSNSWVDFEPIDLAGFKLAAGASFVF